jgi:hypothetical protein
VRIRKEEQVYVPLQRKCEEEEAENQE